MSATAFEVLDALGLSQLVKRSGDLGGTVPLRVAQGCAPLFEGNAFGFQITLRQPITLRRSHGRVDVEIASPYGEALAVAHRAVLRRLVAREVIHPHGLLATAFADDFVKVEGAEAGNVHVRLWTGLCLRADAGVWLRVSATANRRNRFIDVEEHFIADDGAFVAIDPATSRCAPMPRTGCAWKARSAPWRRSRLRRAHRRGAARGGAGDRRCARGLLRRGVLRCQGQRGDAQVPQDEAASGRPRRAMAPARCRVVMSGLRRTRSRDRSRASSSRTSCRSRHVSTATR